MGVDINTAIVCGNIASDIWDNKNNVKFSVASSKWNYAEKKSEVKYIEVVVFGNSARHVKEFGAKGSRVEVLGHLETFTFKGENGKTVYKLSFVGVQVNIIHKGGFDPDHYELSKNPSTEESLGDIPMEDV